MSGLHTAYCNVYTKRNTQACTPTHVAISDWTPTSVTYSLKIKFQMKHGDVWVVASKSNLASLAQGRPSEVSFPVPGTGLWT